MEWVSEPAMRPCSLQRVVAQSGGILHVIALVAEPPPIGGFSAAMPLNRERRLPLADQSGADVGQVHGRLAPGQALLEHTVYEEGPNVC